MVRADSVVEEDRVGLRRIVSCAAGLHQMQQSVLS
jgi:hypothetical protein